MLPMFVNGLFVSISQVQFIGDLFLILILNILMFGRSWPSSTSF